MSKKIFKLSLVLLILSFLVSACTLPWKKKTVTDSNQTQLEEVLVEDENTLSSTNTKQIKKFSSYDELKTFLETNTGNQGISVSSNSAFSAITSESLKKSDSSQSALDYSSTNNQVSGVDEADIIKTNGEYIYALVRNDLKIIKASPASEMKVISTITFKSRPEDIFISGQNLSVFGADQQIYTMDLYKSFRRQNSYTFFKVFDLSNPVEPKLVRDLNFEGSYTDARLINDYVYLFTNSSAAYNKNEPLLPRVFDNGELLANVCEENKKCFTPDVYYFDVPYDSYNFVNVTAINIKDNAEVIGGQAYLMNYGQNLYVSKNNIYITYTEYLNEYDLEQTVKKELALPKISQEDKDKINKIELVDGFILNKNEKQIKVASIIDRYFNSLSEEDQKAFQISIDDGLKNKLIQQSKDVEKTVIHKIAINGKLVEYRGMGEVKGQALNQFSMDENGDYFRIATTRNQIWSRLSDKPNESYSNVFVLDNDLKIVGSLENLATTEQIYSARFMGDRVYLVTFKKTDPLYVIGLSDPAKPSVLGAIKVPGFSSYLHPADKNGNKLIGFGRETEEDPSGNVKIKGLKIALFDFTDLGKPKELDSYIIEGSENDSIALQDHKAFLYSESKNLISIPAVLREAGKISFAGTLVFNIVDNGFVLKGRIDHSEGGTFSNADYFNGYDYYDNTVKRSLYINDNLYTFSNKYIKVNSLADLSPIGRLNFDGSVNSSDEMNQTPVSNENLEVINEDISSSLSNNGPELPVNEGLAGEVSTSSSTNP